MPTPPEEAPQTCSSPHFLHNSPSLPIYLFAVCPFNQSANPRRVRFGHWHNPCMGLAPGRCQ